MVTESAPWIFKYGKKRQLRDEKRKQTYSCQKMHTVVMFGKRSGHDNHGAEDWQKIQSTAMLVVPRIP